MMPRLRLQWHGHLDMGALAPVWRSLLREVTVLGAVLVLLVPAARGSSEWLGWLPLWLLAMPALACWVAHGAPLPRWQAMPARTEAVRRGGRLQARRRRPLRTVMTTGRGKAVALCASVPGL